MNKVKVAIIGAGWWGTTAHLPAFQRHPQAELVAVQARTLDKASRIASDFGVPHACTTVDEVMAVDGLEAVAISSTPNVHYAQAKAALERGLHVLIEKPMTITVAESEELVDLAQRKGVQFIVSCPWHYTSHGAEARRLVQSGVLGEVKMISMLMTNLTAGLYRGEPFAQAFRLDVRKRDRPYREPGQASYSDPAVAGGGHIYTQVSHVGAYLGFLAGVDPAEVFARFDNDGTPVDVYDAISIKLKDGTLASIATHGAPMPSEVQFEIRAYGTRGMLFMELTKGRLEHHDHDGQVTRYPDLERAEVYPRQAPAENLIDSILGLAPNRSPAALGLYAMRIIEAASQSARSGVNVQLW